MAERGGSSAYNLIIRLDVSILAMLAIGKPCSNPGEVDIFHYNAPPYESSDANGDWNADLGT